MNASSFDANADSGPEMRRCPVCDSVLQPDDSVCRMCGATMVMADGDSQVAQPEPALAAAPVAVETAALPAVVESVMRERQSRLNWLITAVVLGMTAVMGALVLDDPVPVTLALVPSPTPIPPTLTYTPTWTPLAQATALSSPTPTITPSPSPTGTLEPPLLVTVASGDTLVSLAFRYQVSVESIVLINNLPPDTPLIQAGQFLSIPRPTPTPPLVPVEVQVGADRLIADPTGCELYEIQQDDTLLAIAARYDVPLPALLAANRLDEQSLIRPGDTVCIPDIIFADFEVFATPGPSPTPGPTLAPPGPALLYPPDQAVVEPADSPVLLQWVAVKDLEPAEWYMIELLDADEFGARPRRGFTRQTSFQVPPTWRPTVPETRLMRWRVTIVLVTGSRQDGGFIYTFGGRASEEGAFFWEGAIPTPTPQPTATPQPSSTP
jgi:LysM repeat protein